MYQSKEMDSQSKMTMVLPGDFAQARKDFAAFILPSIIQPHEFDKEISPDYTKDKEYRQRVFG